MSLSSLRKTYGNGTRRQVINKAIRAEYPNGNEIIDSIRALTTQIMQAQLDCRDASKLEARLAHWEAERSKLAAEIEARHNVGVNQNRRKKVGA